VGGRVTDPGLPEMATRKERMGLSKAKRLRVLVGALLLALSVSLSGVVVTGCGGSGVTPEKKEEAKKEAEKKEKEAEKKQEKEKQSG
jgi:hypothetical protein